MYWQAWHLSLRWRLPFWALAVASSGVVADLHLAQLDCVGIGVYLRPKMTDSCTLSLILSRSMSPVKMFRSGAGPPPATTPSCMDVRTYLVDTRATPVWPSSQTLHDKGRARAVLRIRPQLPSYVAGSIVAATPRPGEHGLSQQQSTAAAG